MVAAEFDRLLQVSSSPMPVKTAFDPISVIPEHGSTAEELPYVACCPLWNNLAGRCWAVALADAEEAVQCALLWPLLACWPPLLAPIGSFLVLALYKRHKPFVGAAREGRQRGFNYQRAAFK